MDIHGSTFAAFISLGLTPAGIDEAEEITLRSFQDITESDLLKWLFQRIRGSRNENKPDVSLSPADSFYLEALLSLIDQANLDDDARPTTRVHHMAKTMDFLYFTRNDRNWSPIKLLNFYYRSNVAPRKRSAIVTCVRNEAINILEWMAHHRAFGFEEFFFYINDSDDKTFEILESLAKNGVCHLIMNDTDLGKRQGEDYFPIQAKALEHAIHILSPLRNFEWVLFPDVDEFLVTNAIAIDPISERPMDDLIQKLTNHSNSTGGVVFNWKWFGSNSTYSRETSLNFERFNNFVGSGHVKTLARLSRCLAFPTSHLPHFPHGDRVLDGGLNPVSASNHTMPIVYDYGQINHYWNKSFEEFVAKYERGWGYRSLDNFFTWGNNQSYGKFERLPNRWINRVKEEIALLQSLPGVEFWVNEAESRFRQSIDRYNTEHNLPALYLSRRFPPVNETRPSAGGSLSNKIGIFRHVLAPSQTSARRPLLYGTERFAPPWIHYWHASVDQPSFDDLACYSVMGAIVSRYGNIWHDSELFSLGNLTDQLNGTRIFKPEVSSPIRQIMSPCVVMADNRQYDSLDKVLDWLIGIGIAQHTTESLNLPMRILLDGAAPEWIRNLIQEVWRIREQDIETYDSEAERIFLGHALVPSLRFGLDEFHPFQNGLINKMIANQKIPDSNNKLSRVFLTQRSSTSQPTRRCLNEAELVELAARSHGFVPVSVENLSLSHRMKLFSTVKIVINNTEQDITTASFCGPDTRFANLGFRSLLTSRVGTFRNFQNAYFMLGTESTSQYRVALESFSEFLDALCA